MPFGPFFVVFGYIVYDPVALTVKQDLQLLSTTVSYFESMRLQLSLLSTLALRLARTARIFVQLAQHHVSTGGERSPLTGQDGSHEADIDFEAIEEYLKWLPSEVAGGIPPSMSRESHMPAAASNQAQDAPGEGVRSLDDVFDWFSWEAYYDNGRH